MFLLTWKSGNADNFQTHSIWTEGRNCIGATLWGRAGSDCDARQGRADSAEISGRYTAGPEEPRIAQQQEGQGWRIPAEPAAINGDDRFDHPDDGGAVGSPALRERDGISSVRGVPGRGTLQHADHHARGARRDRGSAG